MSHTKGPWTAIYGTSFDGTRYLCGVVAANGEKVVFGAASCTSPGHTECDANTVLAAAAPDLLAVVRLLLRSSCGITKGNGESYIGWQDGDDTNAHTIMDKARAAIAKAKGEA